MTTSIVFAAAALVAVAAVAASERTAHAADTTSGDEESEDHSLPTETHFDDAPAAPPVEPAHVPPAPAPVPAAPVAPTAPAFVFAPSTPASSIPTGEQPTPRAPDSPSAWHFGLGVDTDAPLDVAGRISLETPGRIRLSTALGTTPQAYANAVDSVLRSANAYDAGTSELFRAGFGKSVVWRTHVGIRPFEDHGFYVDAGYALVHLGGDTTAAAVASAAGEASLASYTGDASYQLSTTLHMVDAELGWEFPLFQGFRLRTAIGGAFTLRSSTSITSSTGDTTLVAKAGQTVDHAFETYGFLPVVTVGLEYRLF